MSTLKVEGDDELIRKFKQKARERYGQKKGSIKKATMDLIEKWVEQEENVDWEGLEGVIESDRSSVEMEKEMWSKVD
ncbi:MAG: hypothetical protein ABEJ87_05710 [Candidatus Nanohalobium sp.]